MTRVLILSVAAVLLVSGCRRAETPESQPSATSTKTSLSPELELASSSYKKNRDYASLEKIHRHLTTEMKREDVERLLGEPDHSPGQGLDYYSSDREESLGIPGDPHRRAVIGLVLDYRDANHKPTERLKKIELRRIGE
jgi:hypothetical protein